MTKHALSKTQPSEEPAVLDVFHRIICGVDETAESLEAVRQTKRLCAPGGSLTLLIADELDIDVATNGGWEEVGRAPVERQLRGALDRAGELAPGAERKLVDGPPAAALLQAAEEEDASVLALGTHGQSRAAAVATGSIGFRVLHDAPCSVLVARPPLFRDRFPASIAVGVDGSPGSLAAADAARSLAERLDCDLRFVYAAGSKGDLEAVRASIPVLRVDDRDPVDALVAIAGEVDLLVVGSRGLHGLRSLGSVSERVAHKAPSSVLVVRPR
jgi:nucleotide-binding universal stress UspA family protein